MVDFCLLIGELIKMKVVHVESGLGNQMLDYCEYLALRYTQPQEKCYIETLIFDIPECNEVNCQWCGYELDRIFGISVPNIRDFFSVEQWNHILQKLKESRFWERNWNWPVYICDAFRAEGLSLSNTRGDFEAKKIPSDFSVRVKQTAVYTHIRRIYKSLRKEKYLKSDADMLFYTGKEDALIGHRLTFESKGNHIEKIEREIRQSFQFPPFTYDKNIRLSKFLQSHDTVAIHARRGDMLTRNGRYYKTGYFRRAVGFIKKKIKQPVFVFFSDPGSIDFCKNNLNIFGLNKHDEILFVDWNSGLESYRDMQLMSLCKHNIITNSSFGWWGAFLNENPQKITISPEIEINTTNHF